MSEMGFRDAHVSIEMSTRDRLMLASANLASYGFVVAESLPLPFLTARDAVRSTTVRLRPHATDAWMFWLHADHCRSFGADGFSTDELRLHVGAADVLAALVEVLGVAGVSNVRVEGMVVVLGADAERHANGLGERRASGVDAG